MPEEMAAHGVQHLAVILEGYQTLAIDIRPAKRSGGQGRTYVLQLADTEPTAVLARVDVIAVIPLHHQPITSVAQSRGQTWPTVGMLSFLPADLLVARVVEQPARGR